MNKYLNQQVMITSLIIVVIIFSIIFLAGAQIGKFLSHEANKDTFPVTIFYLDGSILHFKCLGTSECNKDVDLGDQIKLANTPNEHPLHIISALQDDHSNLYIILSGSIWNYLAKVNLATNQVQILDLNVLSSSGPNPPFFFPKEADLIGGHMVLATTDGKIGIIQDDFTIKTIDLKVPVFDFFESTGSRIAIISADNRLQNSKLHMAVYFINVISDEVEERTVDGPQESGWIVTTDQEIKHLYWMGSHDSLPDDILHVFDIEAKKDLISTQVLNSDAFAYTTLTAARYQYHGMWYYSRRCCLEGPAPALLLNMSTLAPVVTPGDFLKEESAQTFVIAPFGDNFLIGLNSRVLLVSPNGTVIKTYDLPKQWIDRDYLLLEYRK